MSTDMTGTGRRLGILKSLLAVCDLSIRHLYGAVDGNDDDTPRATSHDLWILMLRLNSEIAAGKKIAGTIADNSTGWPETSDGLIVTNDARSGYPANLATLILHNAGGTTSVLCMATSGKADRDKTDDAHLYEALSAVHSLVLTVSAIIEHVENTAPLSKPVQAA